MRRSYLITMTGFSLISLLLIILLGCNRAPDFWKDAKAGQKKILVSFPPLYCITQAVAGDDACVLCLLTTQGPHEHEDTPTDLLKLKHADLVISNGLSLDDVFIDKMLGSQKNEARQKLEVGEVIEDKQKELLLKMRGHKEEKGHEHKGEKGHDHEHGEFDPHIWLGPDQAIAMTNIIAEKLGEIDPAKKKAYEERAGKFIEKLKELKEYGQKAFKDKKNKNLVTQHESLGYFAKAFGLNIVDMIQLNPGADPDAATLANLAKLCKEDDVKVIAVEPQYPTTQAETLRNTLKKKYDIDARIITIDPVETAPVAAGQLSNPDPNYYLAKMRENIDTLAKALP